MKIEELSEYLINLCQTSNSNKIYICGSCGSGKTTLSKKIYELASQHGNVNLISLDDFMADTELRKKAINQWTENGITYSGRYTSSNVESYFLKNVYEIIYNIDHGINCYYFPRKYKEKNNIRQLKSNYFLTIIEGVGTAFLEKTQTKSLTILLKCSKEDEIERINERTKKLNRPDTDLYDELRSSQYRVNVLKNEDKFDLIIESDNNFNYKINNNISYNNENNSIIDLKKISNEELIKLVSEGKVTEANLTDSGICPTCFDRENNNVLYGNKENKMLYEDELFECFLAGKPRAIGHTIISTKKHYKDMMETNDEICEKIFTLSKKVMCILKDVYNAESVYMCTMCDGPMNHFHIQLIPRYYYEKRGSKNFVKERQPYKEDVDKILKLRKEIKLIL